MTAARREAVAIAPDEAVVVRVARALVGLSPVGAVVDVLETPRDRVPISRDTMNVVEDTLARGLVREIVRRGGHRPVRTPDGKRGRLWERHRPIALTLGRPSRALLSWLVEAHLAVGVRSATLALDEAETLTLGDELMFYLAADLLARAHLGALVAAPAFARSLLTRVGFSLHVTPTGKKSAWSPLLEGDGAVLVEALAPDLARRVLETERERSSSRSVELATRAATAIEAGPVDFARTAIAGGRADLGLFLLEGVGRILSEPATPTVDRPRAAHSLSDRQKIARGGATLFEGALAFREVARRARATGFLDEGYERAQLLAGALEPWTSGGFDRVEAALRGLSTLEV